MLPARILELLFPREKRRWRGSRAARVTLRTLHLLGVSVLFGGHWFGLPAEQLEPWLYLSAVSGAGLIALELWGSFDWALQLAGILVFVKLALLALVPLFWGDRLPLLTAAMVIGSAGSHMPGSLRHLFLLPAPNPPEPEK